MLLIEAGSNLFLGIIELLLGLGIKQFLKMYTINMVRKRIQRKIYKIATIIGTRSVYTQA